MAVSTTSLSEINVLFGRNTSSGSAIGAVQPSASDDGSTSWKALWEAAQKTARTTLPNPASIQVTLSDAAQTLSNQTASGTSDDLSSLMAWTLSFLQGRGELTDSEMNQWVAQWVQSADEGGVSPSYDCTDYINGGPMYYTGTRIPVTAASEAIDTQQSNAFVSELNSMYAAEKAKGTSAMDIYIKIGQLILAQPDNFASKFGYRFNAS